VVGSPYAPYLSLDISKLKDWRNYSQRLVDTNPDFANEYVEDGKIPQDEDSYTSDEDTYAGYVMAKGVWGKLEAIGGVRVDHTRVSSDNYEIVALEGQDPVYTKVKGKANYTSVLPRLQVNYRASNDFVVRGAFYTSIARPEPLYISGATEIEEEDGEVDVTVGNPGLKPAYAYNFDLSVERYFGSVGLISGGLLLQEDQPLHLQRRRPETEGDRARFENDPRLEGKVIDDVTTYTNGKSAEIYGIELNLVRQFTGCRARWAAWASMPMPPSSTARPTPGIDGVAKDDFFNAPRAIFTGAGTYQKYGIEGTLAYSWRDRQAVRFSSYNTRIVEEPMARSTVSFAMR
jgi:TonB-dependent receptor